MDYKRIIKSRSLRLKILHLFSFVPDKTMLKIQYRIKTGRKLDLKNPKRFTEKLQWYKLFYRNPLMIQCVDKADVREYVKRKGLEDILIPCFGVYDSAEEISWDELPESFVMKDTLAGGGNCVQIVQNKGQKDTRELSNTAFEWISKGTPKKDAGREWPYYNGKAHRIIIEKYLKASDEEKGLIDYKFFCFQGKVQFVYVMGSRDVGNSVKVSIYDPLFHKLPVKRVGDEELTGVKKPRRFDEMIHIAEKLSEDFPHVRVDLYYENDFVYFGELTFFNASGYMEYDPDSFDFEIGEKFIIDSAKEG